MDDIDTIVRDALGPRFSEDGVFGLEDMVGLDVLRDAGNQIFPTLDNSKQVNTWLTDKIASGNLGVKSGRGLYPGTSDKLFEVRQRITRRFLDLLKKPKN
jgi:3-hydroxybutyryl-CoA dehydrogenase